LAGDAGERGRGGRARRGGCRGDPGRPVPLCGGPGARSGGRSHAGPGVAAPRPLRAPDLRARPAAPHGLSSRWREAGPGPWAEAGSESTSPFETRIIDTCQECEVTGVRRLRRTGGVAPGGVRERSVARGRARKPRRVPARLGVPICVMRPACPVTTTHWGYPHSSRKRLHSNVESRSSSRHCLGPGPRPPSRSSWASLGLGSPPAHRPVSSELAARQEGLERPRSRSIHSSRRSRPSA